MSAKRKRRWFLPDAPDVLGMLGVQAEATVTGLEAFARWAHGQADLSQAVRDAEHEADTRKAELIATLREAFTTPLQPEDIFELSRGLDEVMNGAKDTVRESDALAMAPNDDMASMADLIAEGAAHLRTAFAAFGHDTAGADAAAAAATKSQRRLERVYRSAMSELAGSDDLREVVGRGELYRRMIRMSDEILLVADRVGYANVKEA